MKDPTFSGSPYLYAIQITTRTMPTTACAQLAHCIPDVLLQGTWIANTNYRQALAGGSLAQALHTRGGLNGMAALTFHVDYYLGGVLHCLQGGPLLWNDAHSFQLSPLHTRAVWEALVGQLLSHAEAFAQALEAQPNAFLYSPFANSKYGNLIKVSLHFPKNIALNLQVH